MRALYFLFFSQFVEYPSVDASTLLFLSIAFGVVVWGRNEMFNELVWIGKPYFFEGDICMHGRGERKSIRCF
jgi:hypothetical protein